MSVRLLCSMLMIVAVFVTAGVSDILAKAFPQANSLHHCEVLGSADATPAHECCSSAHQADYHCQADQSGLVYSVSGAVYSGPEFSLATDMLGFVQTPRSLPERPPKCTNSLLPH